MPSLCHKRKSRQDPLVQPDAGDIPELYARFTLWWPESAQASLPDMPICSNFPPMPYSFFPTAFGNCGMAWNETGLVGFQLPAVDEDNVERKFSLRTQTKTATEGRPEWIRRLVERVQQHMEGKVFDFSPTPLDWSRVSDFQRAVYLQTQAIKPGYTKSYGEIAHEIAVGNKAARAVGVALATNPWPLVVPCHRVVSSSGNMTGFSGDGGIRTKTRLLALEGAELLSE